MSKQEFRHKLIEARENKGLTQTEVADMCKLSVRTIQRIESGQVTPRSYTIKLISKNLDFEFFTNQESKNSYPIQNQLISSNYRSYLRYLIDLFNLKSNTMKKISILSTTLLLTAFLFMTIFHLNGQSKTKQNMNCLRIERNNDQSVKSISAMFSYQLTLDSLVQVRNELDQLGINLDYEKLEFDDNNHLLNVSATVNCNDGFSGDFTAKNLNQAIEKNRTGFVRNYNSDEEIQFCSGTCEFK